MDWINDKIAGFHKRIFGVATPISDEDSGMYRLKERRTQEKVERFQVRLHDLDRRLAELR